MERERVFQFEVALNVSFCDLGIGMLYQRNSFSSPSHMQTKIPTKSTKKKKKMTKRIVPFHEAQMPHFEGSFSFFLFVFSSIERPAYSRKTSKKLVRAWFVLLL